MKTKLYQIDTFTDKLYHGNPAAVCVTDKELSEELMQNIADENNLAETAFVVKTSEGYNIRWFTPAVEVDLCGHATLASAYVLFNHLAYEGDTIVFKSRKSGLLAVTKSGNLLTLDFPSDTLQEANTPQALIDAFGSKPLKTYKGNTDFLLIFSNEEQIKAFEPNMDLIAKAGGRGVIVSAPGIEVDFVSRFFAPQAGIPEDPVTGSAHTTLTPYWSKELNKTKLYAKQLSKRQGDLICEYLGNRVKISGIALSYLVGEIEVS